VLPATGFDDYIANAGHIVDANIAIESSDERTVGEFLDELKTLGVHFSLGIDILSANEGYTAQYFGDSDGVLLERRASR
jgi:hypothetical protein